MFGNEEDDSVIAQVVLSLILAGISLGLGSTITIPDVKLALRSPGAVAIGMLSQFGFMPLLTFLIARYYLLETSCYLAVGFVLVGCSPGGTVSNLAAYFADGNVALSIAMTATSTLCSIFMIPLLIWVYIANTQLGDSDSCFSMPFGEIFISLSLVIVPAATGVFIRHKSEKVAKITEKIGTWTGVMFMLVAVVGGVVVYWDEVVGGDTGWDVLILVGAMQPIGCLFGYLVSVLFKQPKSFRRTICLETGLQNTSFTMTLIALAFDLDENFDIMVPALVASFCIYLHSPWIVMVLRTMASRGDPESSIWQRSPFKFAPDKGMELYVEHNDVESDTAGMQVQGTGAGAWILSNQDSYSEMGDSHTTEATQHEGM